MSMCLRPPRKNICRKYMYIVFHFYNLPCFSFFLSFLPSSILTHILTIKRRSFNIGVSLPIASIPKAILINIQLSLSSFLQISMRQYNPPRYVERSLATCMTEMKQGLCCVVVTVNLCPLPRYPATQLPYRQMLILYKYYNKAAIQLPSRKIPRMTET
jgi:hypothetical protein